MPVFPGLFSSISAGIVKASGGGTTNFLRADGTWVAPSGGVPGGASTSVQYNNAGAFGGITNLTSNGTNPILTAIAAPGTPGAGFGVYYYDSTNKVLALKNDAGTVSSTVVPSTAGANQFATAVSAAGVVTYSTPPNFTSSAAGYAPLSGGGTTNFLRADGTWAAPSGGGAPGGASLTVQYNNAGAFGGMSGTSWDDTNRSLTMTGATVTTSHPVFDMTQTWNAGGVVFTGLRLNVTNTASAAGSILQDLQVGGSSVFQVQKTGDVLLTQNNTGYWVSGVLNYGIGTITSSGITDIYANGFPLVRSNGVSGLVSVATLFGMGTNVGTTDIFLARDAANTLAQRNAGNSQTIRVYNTFTDASNYERFTADWQTTANVCYLRNENAGTGSARLCVYRSGATVVASLPSAATAGSGARAFVTDATATTFLTTVAGGGANKVPVVSDGTNWLIG